MRFRFNDDELRDDKSDLKLISDKDIRPVLFNLIEYDELHFVEHNFNCLSELDKYLRTTKSSKNEDYCTWLNIEGIHRRDILDQLSIRFNLHHLIKEDIYTINERMKLDIFDNGSSIYLLMKMIYIHSDLNRIEQEQISFIFKENNFLITFQEVKDKLNSFDIFQVVKYRLKNNRGRIRSLKIDYLFYSLIDIIIENYMIVLDRINIKIDIIEKLLMYKLKQNKNIHLLTNHFNFQTLKLIYQLKHDMLCFKILCQPLREIIIKLQKAQDRISVIDRAALSRRQYRRKKRPKHIALSGNYFVNPNCDTPSHRWSLGTVQENAPLFNEYIFIYFKHLNDHIIQLHDRINTYCDLLSSLILLYMILNNAETNRIMTFLTLVSIIFIPFGPFIGIFSLNFLNMPPLLWTDGYFVLLATFATFALLTCIFFKWKKLI